jgi:hypothetical protein
MIRGTPIPDTVTVHVPLRLVKRGGRKEMRLPEGIAQPRKTDSALVKALARAFRWKRMLETSEFTTVGEMAEREGIAPSYMTRVLRLTLLAPDIVEAILDGKQGPEVTLARVLEPFPVEWTSQFGSMNAGKTGPVSTANSRHPCDQSITAESPKFPPAGGQRHFLDKWEAGALLRPKRSGNIDHDWHRGHRSPRRQT